MVFITRKFEKCSPAGRSYFLGYLFSGSIMENIHYGNLEASDEEVRKAAKKVKAHDFIVKMEQGYQTGFWLSGKDGLLKKEIINN